MTFLTLWSTLGTTWSKTAGLFLIDLFTFKTCNVGKSSNQTLLNETFIESKYLLANQTANLVGFPNSTLSTGQKVNTIYLRVSNNCLSVFLIWLLDLCH
jgi:hypothetical protein